MTVRRRRRLGIAIACVISAITAAVIAAPGPMIDGTGMVCTTGTAALAPGGPMAQACPNPVNFVGSGSADVMITNAGSGDLVLSGYTGPSAPFSVGWGSDCPAGACTISMTTGHLSTTLHVTYAPSDAGPHTDHVLLSTGAGTYDVVLNGMTPTVPGMLFVNPTTVNLGAAAPGGVASMTVTVTNVGSGSAALSGNSPILDTDWQVDWDAATCPAGTCTLTAGGSGTSFIATFTANTVGPSTTTTSILNDTGTTPVVTLNGSGSAAQLQDLTVIGQPNLDFGTQNVGFMSSPVTFDLKNTGTVDLSPIAIMAMTGSGAPWVISDTGFGLVQGATKTISVACKPMMAGTFDDLLVVTPPANTTVHSTANFAMHCVGVDGAVHPAPSPISLGEMRVGSTVAPVVVTLSTSGAPFDITAGPSLTGSNPALAVGAASPSTITGAQPATFALTVDTATEDLDLGDTISLTAGTVVSIGVTGKITTPAIAHSEDLDLGTFCIGQPTPSSVATFTASGTATIVMHEPTLAMGAASPFSATYKSPPESSYASGFALAAGATATVSIHANDQQATGDVADQLVWPSDMPNEPMATTRLTAHFIHTGGAIAPKTLDFGPVSVHQTSEVHSLALQNCGDAPITLAPLTISSNAFHDMSATPLPGTLAPGEIARVDLVFSPQKAGLTHATLAIDASTGPLEANLLGIGLGGADSDGDQTGFYACSCASGHTSPVGALAIGLAVASAIGRRRKR